MQQSLGLNAEDAHSAACAVLAQLPPLPEQLQTRKEEGIMELLTSVLVAGGICVCIGAVKAVCRRLNRK